MFVLEQEEYMREGENFREISEMTFHELLRIHLHIPSSPNPSTNLGTVPILRQQRTTE